MSIDIFNTFAVNESLANNGVWVPFMGDVEFLIARDANHQYKKLIQAQFKRYERLLNQGGDAAETKGREITIDVVARTILLDWKGDLSYQGQPVGAYSVEKAKELLAQEGFLKFVQEQSRSEKDYKEVQDKEDEKN